MTSPPRLSNPVRIAPAPSQAARTAQRGCGPPNHGTMPYTCQPCTRRKVRCDKVSPVCYRCRKADIECSYPPPRPRQKRKLDQAQEAGLPVEIREKLAKYERILRENKLLAGDGDKDHSSTGFAELPQLFQREPSSRSASTPGILLGNDEDRAQFIDSHLWRSLGDDEIQRMSEDAGKNVNGGGSDPFDLGRTASDPLTDAFLDTAPTVLTTDTPEQTLLQHHPISEDASFLWATYMKNVDPLCRVLHIPSAKAMIEQAWQTPERISRADECLLFAIYHFAVFSLSEEKCTDKLGQTRTALLQRYNSATRRAFVNASFLKNASMTVLQALVLFLIPCRHIYDPNTYWILTGVAMRIGQRLGLHHDGEKLDLSPFQVEMRRRLFYAILPLDSSAAQISGVGVSTSLNTWDTEFPRNVNDHDLWPGMTETPVEKGGPTEMMFPLSRFCIGKHLVRVGGPAALGNPTSHFGDLAAAEKSVSQAEAELEERFVRYCDVLNPLHFLSMSLARAGVLAMRLKIRLPRIRNQSATDAEIREALHFAGKIMDTDSAIHAQENVMERFRWHARPFFVWGMWDSFIFALMTLLKRSNLLSAAERREVWGRVENVYLYHDDLLSKSQSQPTLNAGFRRLTLKAWDAHLQPADTGCGQVPAFIESLREVCAQGKEQLGNLCVPEQGGPDGNMTHHDIFDGFNLEGVDWGSTWDLFISDNTGS
ncbi:fungal-specific transcription factor domain-containing protein [Aspergillus oleicola]